jgi:hypothetical protein
MRVTRDMFQILVGKPEGRRPVGRHGKGERIILKWILRTLGLGVWIGFISLRIGISGGLL